VSLIAAGSESFEAPGIADFWQPLVGDGAFALTRTMVVFGVTAVLLSLVLARISGRLKVVPGRTQFATEGVYSFVRNSLGREIIGSKDFKPFIPLLFSLFTVILVNNVFGVIPFVQFPTFSRLGYAAALTAVVYVTYHTVGIRRKGFGGWLKSFIPGGLPPYIVPVMFILEFLTYVIIRPATLALRLMGNMLAGHLLLLVFTVGGEFLLLHSTSINKVPGVLSFGMTLVMSAFEILVEFLQAYIFVLLTAVYIAGAVADEH
jgi:F-type H+-transporting ATPase subunit a